MSYWPQYTMAVLFVLSFGVNAVKHGQTTKYNVGVALTALAINVTLLYFGGFWHGAFN